MRCQFCDARCCALAGAVLLTKEDIIRISDRIDTNFKHKAYDKVDGFVWYINKVNINDEYSDCIFKGEVKNFIGCTIYEDRPEVCRLYNSCKEEFGII